MPQENAFIDEANFKMSRKCLYKTNLIKCAKSVSKMSLQDKLKKCAKSVSKMSL